MKPKPDPKRGRHKKRTSPEVRRWDGQYLVPPPPPWMDLETWRKLAAMRNGQ